MIHWSDVFYFSIISASQLLSVLGMWFTVIVAGMDRWNRRFFLNYFIVFMLCCVTGLADVILS